jgi:hypothetical protein
MATVQKSTDSSSRAENDLTRLVCEIQRASGRLEHVTVEMRRTVARLRSIPASDAAGVRVAWSEPAGSNPAFGARGNPELNGDRQGQVEQRVVSRLEQRSP